MKYKRLLKAIDDYIKERRQLGYMMYRDGKHLYNFVQYAHKIGHKGPITIKLALQWAKLPQNCKSEWWATRLSSIRDFTKYMKLIDPKTEIPPLGIIRFGPRRATPYIYSEQEIIDIMKAIKRLATKFRDKLQPHTYTALFGLLICSGIRTMEALKLSRDDIDFNSGILTIIEGKFKKSRLIPLHPTALKPLKDYVKKRDKKFPIPKTKAFFVNRDGNPLTQRSVKYAFRLIKLTLGWNKKGGRRQRVYDIRHTFATRKLLEAYRKRKSIDQIIQYLSTYLGHALVSSTYWYLSAVPELMEIVSSRFEKFVNRKGGGISYGSQMARLTYNGTNWKKTWRIVKQEE